MTKKPKESTTAVVYIGRDRYQHACKQAREISALAEANIKPSEFIQYLLDHYSNEARAKLLMELRGE